MRQENLTRTTLALYMNTLVATLANDLDVLNAFAGVSDILTQRMSKEPTPELSEVCVLPTYFLTGPFYGSQQPK